MREMHKMKNDKEKQYEAERLAAFQEEYRQRVISRSDSVETPMPAANTAPATTPKEVKYKKVRDPEPVYPPAPTLPPTPRPLPTKSKFKSTPSAWAKPVTVAVAPDADDDSSSDESEYIQRKKKKAEKTIQQIQHLDNALLHATARVNPFTALFMR
jgi:hypothetical protein